MVSWGSMLNQILDFQSFNAAPWMMAPVGGIILTVLAFNAMGDGLRDAVDPYQTSEATSHVNQFEQILLKAKDIVVGFPIIEGFVHAVRGVSFEIIQGKTLALVGESGSGKSVTARALMGMLSERAVVGKSASVEFSGQQLIGLSEEQLQKIRGSAISMIFQEPMTSLNPLYTAGNQIIESIQAHRKMPKKEARSEPCDSFKRYKSQIRSETGSISSSAFRRPAPKGDDCFGNCK